MKDRLNKARKLRLKKLNKEIELSKKIGDGTIILDSVSPVVEEHFKNHPENHACNCKEHNTMSNNVKGLKGNVNQNVPRRKAK